MERGGGARCLSADRLKAILRMYQYETKTPSVDALKTERAPHHLHQYVSEIWLQKLIRA